MTDTAAPGQPIIPPADFPVNWENPADARLTWQYAAHATVPVAPLSRAVSEAVTRGIRAAMAHLGWPMQGRSLLINGYPYHARVPARASSPWAQTTMGLVRRVAPNLARRTMERALAGMTSQLQERLQPILARLETRWHDELLPEQEQHLAYLERCDLRGLSLAQLRAQLAEGLRRAERVGELHALAGVPAVMAMSLFEELYLELFPGTSSLEALRLIQGVESQTLAGDRALWALSRRALAKPTVQQVLVDNEPAAALAALEESDAGRRFLAELRRYLDQFGRRLNVFGDLTEPSWWEAPVTAVACLQSYLHQPVSDPEANQARLTAAREEAVAAARRQLAGQPPATVSRFETLLRAAQASAGIKEDNHWLLQRLYCQMRRLALMLGRRLREAGMVPDPEDVFYLTAEELLAETTVPVAVLQERKAARAHFRQVTPPPMLGTAPLFDPAGANPFIRALQKADMTQTRRPGGDAALLRGRAASAGVRRGQARIITSLTQADALKPGEVLITKATTPPWTPLFGIAAAVVTDTGGVLSHCAVVAREYGIPAVVGTGQATQVFRNGQMLEVDGAAGTVRLIT